MSTTTTRLRVWLMGLVLALTATMVVTVANPTAAHAATCRTLGHAYLIYGGNVYFSGYEGDQRFGIPTLTIARGSWVELGGNGIRPRTQAIFVDSVGFNYTTTEAGKNCVIRQESNRWQVNPNISPGTYLVDASYLTPTKQVLKDPVVYLNVI